MKEKKPIDVTICTSLSKTARIYTDNYTVIQGVNEDTKEVEQFIDIYDCNLVKEVRKQLILPQDACKALEKIQKKLSKFDDELLNIFQFEKVCEFMFQLPSNKDKYFLVKFRLIFIILFLHLKKDYQKIKFLTSIDFLAGSILERQKFKYLLFSLNNPLNEEINEKYYKENYNN